MDLMKFNFENERIRVIQGDDGNPWFVASDVARVLGYEKPKLAINRHCDEAAFHSLTDNLGRSQKAKIIPESDVYNLTFGSKLEKAKKFRKWITKDVLPSLRQKGYYGLDNISRKDLAKMLWESETEKEQLAEKARQQQEELKEAAPKVEYHDEVIQAQGAMTTTQMASEWDMSAYRLNRILHNLAVQYKHSGTWILYQRYKNKGYVGYRTATFTNNHGETKTAHTMVWTENGKQFVYQLLKRKGYI